jgi:hypothetical protein
MTDKKFPMKLWVHLLEQAQLTLNLLRQSQLHPHLSAYASLFGQFDFNKTPLARPLNLLTLLKIRTRHSRLSLLVQAEQKRSNNLQIFSNNQFHKAFPNHQQLRVRWLKCLQLQLRGCRSNPASTGQVPNQQQHICQQCGLIR